MPDRSHERERTSQMRCASDPDSRTEFWSRLQRKKSIGIRRKNAVTDACKENERRVAGDAMFDTHDWVEIAVNIHKLNRLFHESGRALKRLNAREKKEEKAPKTKKPF